MSDVSFQKSGGQDSATTYEGQEEKKGEDSWTDVSLNDDSDAKGRGNICIQFLTLNNAELVYYFKYFKCLT